MPVTIKDMNEQMAHSGDGATQALLSKFNAKKDKEMLAQKGEQEGAQARLQAYLQGQAAKTKDGFIDESGKYTPGTSLAAKQAEQAGAIDQVTKLRQDLGKTDPGRKINTKVGDVDVSEATQFPSIAMQKLPIQQENAYAKALLPYSDANGALTAIEQGTNADGKGGILTNPDAKLLSFGPLAAKMSDQQVALGEWAHKMPPGSADERKTVARAKLALGHAMNGARNNPAMVKMIQDSLGQISSGDPDLMSKGLRGAGRILGGQLNTVQGGFGDDVKDAVHTRMGGDPAEMYRNIPPEQPFGGTKTPPAPTAPPQAPKPQAPAPQNPYVAAPPNMTPEQFSAWRKQSNPAGQ